MSTSGDDIGKLILRVTVGGLMLFHGISKVITGIPWLPSVLADRGLPEILAYGV